MIKEHRIVIVGGGPMCTYALERLAALLAGRARAAPVRIAVFERGGRFGAGETHSDRQATTSYMNRIAAQITFAADESNVASPALLPKLLRPTFLEWCRERYRATGDSSFDLGARDVPKRFVHGLALREMFGRYATLLAAMPGVAVDLYPCDAVDVSREVAGDAPYRVHRAAAAGAPVPADAILFVTGHSQHHPQPGSPAAAWAARGDGRYIAYPYPLAQRLTEETVPPGSTVGVQGLGLAAIDVFLHLTEGRGGAFLPTGAPGPLQQLRYQPSDREPALIVGCSPSGMLVSCRPLDAKESDPALQHQGVFFTLGTVRALRHARGRRLAGAEGRPQLDFEREVLPLLVLEMAFVYYRTLLGEPFGAYLRRRVAPRARAFLRHGPRSRDAVDELLAPVAACFEEAADYLQRSAAAAPIPGRLRRFVAMGLRGADRGASVRDRRFDWRAVFEPFSAADAVSGAAWRARLLAWIEQDLAAAAEGNLANPLKAACDGVWRDLRAVLSEAVDAGGLLLDSHRRFISVYMRYYNRLSNGTGIVAMRKVLALVESGRLDVSTGPRPVVERRPDGRGFRIRGSRTGAVSEVDVLVDGKVHAFDAELDTGPLYPNLLRRGLVRKWRHPGSSPTEALLPGGLDLSADFHPLQPDGSVDSRLTFLGAPAEGVRFFQTSVARPYTDSYVLNHVATWAAAALAPVLGAPAPAGRLLMTLADLRDPAPAGAGLAPSLTEFRARVRAVLAEEAETARPRHVVILAVDGIPYARAHRAWTHARIERMRSVFPTTSATAWLSSLSGMSVAAHGVPGARFRLPEHGDALIDVFTYQGPLATPATENIFSDAAARGYLPLSMLGDLVDLDCSWRDVLLRHSRPLAGPRFYTGDGEGSPDRDPETLCRQLRAAVLEILAAHAAGPPCLLWCFLDVDRHVHRHGYDRHVERLLAALDHAACELTRANAVVLAHSDHGLARTRQDPRLERLLAGLAAASPLALGGAGRCRWIYARPGTAAGLLAELARQLPPRIRLADADALFPRGSLARARVGDVVLIAEGEDFLASPGYRFEHGSMTAAEVDVPLAEWRA